jgi:phosphopantothenoylcysteine decarboxylase/phosphopantothenate--cysteine ligase
MTRESLAGKKIVIAITGSIAAVETVRLVHALRRCGAEVQAV